MAEKLGMKIHSVLFGWANFNSRQASTTDIASVEAALAGRAQAYGADAVLLVPCRIGGMAMSPEPWEFDIEFDEKTGHVKRVVAGDNAQYAEYIEAHNQAIDTSREAVEKLIPVAEKTGVIIALENVWNNLWVQAGDLRQLRRVVRQPLGAGLLRHRQPREVRAAGGVDPRAGQADRQVPREGLQAQRPTATAASSSTSATAASTGRLVRKALDEDRLQRLDDDRGRRPVAGGASASGWT